MVLVFGSVEAMGWIKFNAVSLSFRAKCVHRAISFSLIWPYKLRKKKNSVTGYNVLN